MLTPLRTICLTLLLAAPLVASAAPAVPTLTFLSHTYQLGSFNKKGPSMWEFACAPETVNNWTTLVTLIDCTNRNSNKDLDDIASGITSTYQSNHAQILLSRTYRGKAGQPYNYLVAAFEEPPQHRYEINFVKVGMAKNAYILIYGARVGGDARTYVATAKKYISDHSSEIGDALANYPLPDIEKLPQKEF